MTKTNKDICHKTKTKTKLKIGDKINTKGKTKKHDQILIMSPGGVESRLPLISLLDEVFLRSNLVNTVAPCRTSKAEEISVRGFFTVMLFKPR